MDDETYDYIVEVHEYMDVFIDSDVELLNSLEDVFSNEDAILMIPDEMGVDNLLRKIEMAQEQLVSTKDEVTEFMQDSYNVDLVRQLDDEFGSIDEKVKKTMGLIDFSLIKLEEYKSVLISTFKSDTGVDSDKKHLININSLEYDKLCALPGISPFDAALIIKYRMKGMPIKSFDDLSELGLKEYEIKKLKSIIKIEYEPITNYGRVLDL